MRTILRLLVFTFFAAVVWGVFISVTTLDFGERPEASFGPVPDDPTVKFIKANGIRFGYLEAGRGPLVLLFHGYPENRTILEICSTTNRRPGLSCDCAFHARLSAVFLCGGG